MMEKVKLSFYVSNQYDEYFFCFALNNMKRLRTVLEDNLIRNVHVQQVYHDHVHLMIRKQSK